MTHSRRIHEFYFKLALAGAALVAAAGCASSPPTPEPTPEEGSTTVYIVRHAEKQTFNANDPDPDISSAGRVRARDLATRLGTSGVTAIVTTQYKRTQETAEPLAEKLGITPEVIDAGHVGDNEIAAEAIMRHKGSKVLVVGHSNTIAPLIEALGGPHLPNLCDSQYSNLFIVYIPPVGKTQLIRQHYGGSDPMPTQDCLAMSSR
jgi:phosphohistidine phosphatase SixA